MKNWHKGLLLIVCIATALLVLFFDRAATGGDSYPQAQFWRYRVNGAGDRLMLPTISAAGLSINGKLFVNKDAQFNSCVVVEKDLNIYGTLVQAWGTTSSENIKTFSGPGLKVQGYMLRVNAGNGLATGATYGSDVHAVGSTAITVNPSGISVKFLSSHLAATAGSGLKINLLTSSVLKATAPSGLFVKFDGANLSSSASSGLMFGPSINIRGQSIGTIPLTLHGKAGQTSDYFKIRTSSAGDVWRFIPPGAIVGSGGGTLHFNVAGMAIEVINSDSASNVAFVVKGKSAQAVDLQQWRSSSDSVLSYVDKSGAAGFPSICYPPQSSPARTLEGATAYANSTGWNPGKGKGLYTYDGATWQHHWK